MMTIEQFRSTRTWSDNLSGLTVIGEGWYAPQGNLYLGCLYIEQVQPHWPAEARAAGAWHLLIANREWITDDLGALEAILYDWAISEGYTLEEAKI